MKLCLTSGLSQKIIKQEKTNGLGKSTHYSGQVDFLRLTAIYCYKM